MDNFLRFNFGPQWQLRLHNDGTIHSRRSLHPTLNKNKLAHCLAQLPFLANRYTLRSHQHLCLIEQVDLQEELNTRLAETLSDCCNNMFPSSLPSSSKSSGSKLSAFFSSSSTPPPYSSSRRTQNNSSGHQQQEQEQQLQLQQQQLLKEHYDKGNHTEMDSSLGNWNHAFLFAREKIVVHCCNKDQYQNNPITNELLYYLKILVADYICEGYDYDSKESHLKQQHEASEPQAITHSTTTHGSTSTDDEMISPSTSSPTLCTSSSSNISSNQKASSFSYLYDSSAPSPFKIHTKSAITQVTPSITTIPSISWSNPPPLVHSYLLSRLPKGHQGRTPTTSRSSTPTRDMDDDLLNEMTAAIRVTSLTPSLDHHYHQHNNNNDTPLPPNAKALYRQYVPSSSSPTSPSLSTVSLNNNNSSSNNNNMAYLSSSVPSHALTNISVNSVNYNRYQNMHDEFPATDRPIARRASANSSPVGRSRRQSMVDQHQQPYPNLIKYTTQSEASDDSSQDEQEQRQVQKLQQQRERQQRQQQQQQQQLQRQRGTVKMVRRWVKHGNRIIMTRICLSQITDGLVAILLFSDETLPSSVLASLSSTKSLQYHQRQRQQHQQMKQFTSSLRFGLQDFTSFLLTKESVHFTILSFAANYPGLVHFIHIKKGVVSSPQLVDLNELDKHHEILYEIYERYDVKPTTTMDTLIGKWRWPSVSRLKKLCGDMLACGLSSRLAPPKIRTLQHPTDHRQGFQFLYLSGRQQQLLRQHHRHHRHHHHHHHHRFLHHYHHHQQQQHQQEQEQLVDQDHQDELLAVYFSFVPSDRIWAMHQQLLSDVSQRHFMK
ncbi:uncharacterized protein BX664DRAFT_347703 [Halteromyces radiatus]|uniref:uncharacterized protein n=1 Tax=Halteromyces radiatus TaxID=101107 RepID=UPI002220795C|nr:uncharacterized protein BX664DRAFT_347703 [Halteromyces radiatus]KAI8097749.1 hypothetical protein BX664DRAFT_347703 [Halteromyces radiatus]